MKILQACVGLVLAMVLGVSATTANAMAVGEGKYADVTKSQLDAAIVQAEQALAREMSSKFDGDKVYLQKLVNQAKELTADFAANVDKNLGELTAALSEGAQVLIIRANADVMSNQVASAPVETYVAIPAVYTTTEVVSDAPARVRIASYTMESNQVAGVISEENRLKLEAQSQGNSYGASNYASGNRGTAASSDKGDAQNEMPESYDSEVSGDEIEVPRAGGGVESAKPSGVGIGLIIVGVVLFAGAGAMIMVRNMKRN